MKAVIMAGGKGTRISAIAQDIPKPMLPIDGIPVLEHEISSLKNQGIKEIIITISYLGNIIKDYFGDGSKFGVNIEYFFEEQPLGNAGALFEIKDKLLEDFLLLNADAIFDVDFDRMIEHHKKKAGLVTLFTHPNSHPYDSGLIFVDSNDSVIKWLSKTEERTKWYKNRVNAGIHILSPKVLAQRPAGATVDLDKQILKPLCGTGKMFIYDSPEYVRDMGTPERYFAVCGDYKKGIVASKNLSNKQKAVFLDRDGTINKYVGFLKNIDDFELQEHVAKAINLLNHSKYLVIVVTNQPVIARGEVTTEGLNEIHNKMETLLGQEAAYIDALYYCPHHPNKGYEGERIEYKIECDCRKPKPGMLIKAAEEYNIDLSQSWMIGDGENDIKAGIAAGCKTILINENINLLNAVKKLLEEDL